MNSEGEIARMLNAVSATLNDQADQHFDPERVDAVAAGSGLTARADPGHPDTGWLLDERGARVAEIRRRDGRWEVGRLAPARSETYVPPPPPARGHLQQLLPVAGLAVFVFAALLVVLGLSLWICILVAVGALLVGGAAGRKPMTARTVRIRTRGGWRLRADEDVDVETP